MAIDRQALLDVGGEQITAYDFAKILADKSASVAVSLLADKQIKLQRRIRISVLRTVLQDEADKRKADRSSRLFRRLLWFEEFSEWQYEHYLNVLDEGGQLYERFRTELWLEVLSSAKVAKVFPELYAAVISAEPDAESDSTMFCRLTEPLFGDKKGELDGLTPGKFRAVLFNSATIDQIRQVGIKYGLSIPRRLRKAEIITAIADVYTERGENVVTDMLESLSVEKLEAYIKDNDLPIKTELRKENLIEYILKYADSVKEVYSEPVSSDAYDRTPQGISKEEYKKIVAEDTEESAPKAAVPKPKKSTTSSAKKKPATKKKQAAKAVAAKPSEEEWEGPGANMEEVMRELKELRKEIEDLKVSTDDNGQPVEDDAGNGLGYVFGREDRLRNSANKPSDSAVSALVSSDSIVTQEFDEEEQSDWDSSSINTDSVVATEPDQDKTVAPNINVSSAEEEDNNKTVEVYDRSSTTVARKIKPAKQKKKASALKITLLTVMWIIIAAAVIALVYSAVTFFANIPALDNLNATINKLSIGGKGILEHLHAFWGWVQGLFVK